MVGPGSDHPHRLRKLVDRLSQRLVLTVLSALGNLASHEITGKTPPHGMIL
jgi:hypothetical protein